MITWCQYCKEEIPVAMPFCSSACRDWQQKRHEDIAVEFGHTRRKSIQTTRVYFKVKFPGRPFPRRYTFVNDCKSPIAGGEWGDSVEHVYEDILTRAGMTRYKPQEMSSREAHRLLASDEYKAKYK